MSSNEHYSHRLVWATWGNNFLHTDANFSDLIPNPEIVYNFRRATLLDLCEATDTSYRDVLNLLDFESMKIPLAGAPPSMNLHKEDGPTPQKNGNVLIHTWRSTTVEDFDEDEETDSVESFDSSSGLGTSVSPQFSNSPSPNAMQIASQSPMPAVSPLISAIRPGPVSVTAPPALYRPIFTGHHPPHQPPPLPQGPIQVKQLFLNATTTIESRPQFWLRNYHPEMLRATLDILLPSNWNLLPRQEDLQEQLPSPPPNDDAAN